MQGHIVKTSNFDQVICQDNFIVRRNIFQTCFTRNIRYMDSKYVLALTFVNIFEITKLKAC